MDETPAAEKQSVVPATIVSWSLAAANVGMFLATELISGRGSRNALITLGAKVYVLIDQGEYWRLLTAAFLHVNLAHLLFNMMALLTFGRMAEVAYGHTRFTAIYLVAAITGSLASYAFTRGLSVGASGALFGVAAALVVLFARNRHAIGQAGRNQLTGYLMLLGINLALGYVQPGIDVWGHLGGVAGGAIVGYALAPHIVRPPAVDDPSTSSGQAEPPPPVQIRRSSAASWAAVPLALLVVGALLRLMQA